MSDRVLLTLEVLRYWVDHLLPPHDVWYCDDRFLTKNGQSRFNPIRVVDWASLGGDWGEAQMVIQRRQAGIGNEWISSHRSASA